MSALQKMAVIDVRFLLWLHAISRRKVSAFVARNVSRCGDGYVYALAGVAAWQYGGSNGVDFFRTGVMAYLIELSLYFFLKNTIRRPRPHGLGGLSALINPSDTFSFPSGHTAAAFVFATLCAVFFPAFALPALIAAVLIGLSRVVLGVHYPSDIAAGAALGVACAGVALLLI
ncbi:MAG: phosphatase PAP2 family protein [Neisseria sp.]|nr:phosphatase PAP2 family protein [Neisseria sp.]